MKKIGKEVCFLKTDENNCRNGEGAFFRISENEIIYAYSRYDNGGWDDHCPADIYAISSYDEGETWENKRMLVKHDSANVMCVSFVRFDNGDIGLFYLKKDSETYACTLHLVRSEDNGKTWSKPLRCIENNGYYVTNNDRVLKLKSGRIIFPANLHLYLDDSENRKSFGVCGRSKINIFASDDDGKSWYLLAGGIELPVIKSKTGLQETGLYQYENGDILAFSRTDLGTQYECISKDDGKTWSVPQPNNFFTSPDAPMQMKKVCGDKVVAIFNPVPKYTARILENERTWGRTPFVCAVSEDDGKTFKDIYYLEDDLENGYCYPAVFDGDDYFLVAYYHSNNSVAPLNSTKIVKIRKEEL